LPSLPTLPSPPRTLATHLREDMPAVTGDGGCHLLEEQQPARIGCVPRHVRPLSRSLSLARPLSLSLSLSLSFSLSFSLAVALSRTLSLSRARAPSLCAYIGRQGLATSSYYCYRLPLLITVTVTLQHREHGEQTQQIHATRRTRVEIDAALRMRRGRGKRERQNTHPRRNRCVPPYFQPSPSRT